MISISKTSTSNHVYKHRKRTNKHKKGRQPKCRRLNKKSSFTTTETNYYAVLSQSNEFDEDEPAKTVGSEINNEIAMIGAGVGGGFTNIKELIVINIKML